MTIFLLSGWLGSRYPGIDPFSHANGHLWEVLFGWTGNPHLNPLHLLSNVVIAAGLVLLAAAWHVLYQAQRQQLLATAGPYAYVRHPQYIGFALIMAGFLLQWPTIITAIMFPVLLIMYRRLARREEDEMRRQFGRAYDQYALVTPAFFPRLRQPRSRHS